MKKKLLLIIGLSVTLFSDFTRDDVQQIVTDNETGLQWQDNESKDMGWVDAITYCKSLTLANYNDWRLPNINELNSIVISTKSNPSFSSVFRTYIGSTALWSSTTVANDSNSAWFLSFRFGEQVYNNKSYTFAVKCVRIK